MSTVADIIEAVRQLSEDEKGVLLEQLSDLDFDDAWDRRIEADAQAGNLDFLWKEAQREIAQGTARPLDEILRDK